VTTAHRSSQVYDERATDIQVINFKQDYPLPFQRRITRKFAHLVTLVYPAFAPVTLNLIRWPWNTNLIYSEDVPARYKSRF